eukprot:606951_1
MCTQPTKKQKEFEFQINEIKRHILLDNETVYQVSWKPLLCSKPRQYLKDIKYINDIETIETIHNNKEQYAIFWKHSWITMDQLAGHEDYDQVLASYCLLCLKRQSESLKQVNSFVDIFVLWIKPLDWSV